MADHLLYVIEEDTDEGPQLLRRYDENGIGSPLVWLSREHAEETVRRYMTESGIYGQTRVVRLDMTERYAEPHYCVTCDVWGSYAEHYGHDTDLR